MSVLCVTKCPQYLEILHLVFYTCNQLVCICKYTSFEVFINFFTLGLKKKMHTKGNFCHFKLTVGVVAYK